MLTITDAAANHLSEILNEAAAPEGSAVRFLVSREGLSLEIDSPREDDQSIEHDGRTVLVMDPQVAELLSDKTLAFQETAEGPVLLIEGEGGEAGSAA